MTADVQRELAEAVMADPGLRLDVQCGRFDHAAVILTLLPTVQALIADAENPGGSGDAAGRGGGVERQGPERRIRRRRSGSVPQRSRRRPGPVVSPAGAPGTASAGYRSPAPHVCVTGPYEFGRRPCCTPVPAPRRTNEGAKA